MKRLLLGLLLLAACKEPVIRDINEVFAPTPDACATCRVPAGENHVCGTTEWCGECRVDAVPFEHVCHQNYYCAGCRKTHVRDFHELPGE